MGIISLRDMKLLYERYCFLKHYSEMEINTPERETLLDKFGFQFVKKQDHFTEVFARVRLLD